MRPEMAVILIRGQPTTDQDPELRLAALFRGWDSYQIVWILILPSEMTNASIPWWTSTRDASASHSSNAICPRTRRVSAASASQRRWSLATRVLPARWGSACAREACTSAMHRARRGEPAWARSFRSSSSVTTTTTTATERSTTEFSATTASAVASASVENRRRWRRPGPERDLRRADSRSNRTQVAPTRARSRRK